MRNARALADLQVIGKAWTIVARIEQVASAVGGDKGGKLFPREHEPGGIGSFGDAGVHM